MLCREITSTPNYKVPLQNNRKKMGLRNGYS